MPDYEYRRFGEQIVRRLKDSIDDWQIVPDEERQDAEVEVRVEERLRQQNLTRGAQFGVQIIRASPE